VTQRLEKVMTDAAAGYLASKGSAVHLEAVGDVMWETLVATLLDQDPRFAASSAGMYELTANRERRAKAMARVA
jgi:hypothetical protein